MFKVDTNQVIKMTKGDDVRFSLVINKDSERYIFKPNEGCKVYFFIYDYGTLENHPWNHIDSEGYNPNTSSEFEPILFKEFGDDGTIGTTIYGEDQEEVTGAPNIDDDGNMRIWIFHTDTLNIPQGSYIYQIKTKLLDTEYDSADPHYVYDTVTNRLPIYIIDDNYSYREW